MSEKAKSPEKIQENSPFPLNALEAVATSDGSLIPAVVIGTIVVSMMIGILQALT